MHALRTSLVALALAACHGAPDPQRPGGASAIRAIDWQNRTYDLADLGSIAVKAGAADFAFDDNNRIVPSGRGAGTGYYKVEPALFADVNADGTEDAIITSVTGTGGTGAFSQIQIYTVRDHKVVELAAIAGGDRGDGGIRKVTLDGAAIIVERNLLADGDGACCASQAQRERWTWKNGQLVEDTAARKTYAIE